MPDDLDELITMAAAAELCGLAPATLRDYAAQGRLRTVKMSARMSMTTRRWLSYCLAERGKGSLRGRPPKPVPDEVLPRIGRGRPRKPTIKAPVPPAADDDRDTSAGL